MSNPRQLRRITPRGVLLENGKEYELDIIVCATGFDAMTGPLLNIDIQGRDGLAPARRLGGRGTKLSRPSSRRFPQYVHHYRTR